jgi:dephospho-CoA kinase
VFIVGITGGIGCGKTTVAKAFADRGITVLDADAISREVTEPKGEALPQIAEAFGPEVFNEEGGLDREKMAAIVFRDRNQVDRLSRIIHEVVLDMISKGIDNLTRKKEKVVILDVPIPVKKGFVDRCDFIIVVWADHAIRLERLAERGMDAEEAERRMLMQMTEEEYTNLADQVFYNNDGIDLIDQFVDEFIKKELNPRGIQLPN